jgi:hypothetical protein
MYVDLISKKKKKKKQKKKKTKVKIVGGRRGISRTEGESVFFFSGV